MSKRTEPARVRILPDTRMLNELDDKEEVEYAETFAYRARSAAEELSKMGPALAALGQRMIEIARDAEDVAAYRMGLRPFDVTISREGVLAWSNSDAASVVGEQGAIGCDTVDIDIEPKPWSPER